MIRATDFEFRNRLWLFGLIFGAGFLLLAFDHVPVGSRIADRLAAAAFLTETAALHIVFGIAAAITVVATLVRMWGSAYLGREVVHDHALHSEFLRADGPYRHVRNPLYLGNVLMAIAVSSFAPLAGCPHHHYRHSVFLLSPHWPRRNRPRRGTWRRLPRLHARCPAPLAFRPRSHSRRWNRTRLAQRSHRRSLFHFFRSWRNRFCDLSQHLVAVRRLYGLASSQLARRPCRQKILRLSHQPRGHKTVLNLRLKTFQPAPPLLCKRPQNYNGVFASKEIAPWRLPKRN
jgi:protein-S-isoprenylcysteine O-methyltransferase Ste14